VLQRIVFAAARRFANGQNFREVGLHQYPSERKGEGVPVRSLRVPSHVPSHPQTAATASSRLDDQPARAPIMAWAREDETIIVPRRRRCGSVLRSGEVGHRCGEAEQREDGQCDRRPASRG
jgi:hypothetical protein